MCRAAASSSKAPCRYLPILLSSIWQFRLAFIWYQPDLVPTIFFFNIFAKGTSICACKRKCTGQCLSGVWLTVVGGSRGWQKMEDFGSLGCLGGHYSEKSSAGVFRLSSGVSIGRAQGKRWLLCSTVPRVSNQQSNLILPGSDRSPCQAGRAADAAPCRLVVKLSLTCVQCIDWELGPSQF